MDEQERMRILLSAMPEPGKSEWRRAQDGTSLQCLARHFEGAGLLEVGHCNGISMTFFRLSMAGEPLGIFERDGLGEDHLIFDQEAQIGDAKKADAESVEMMRVLRDTLTPEEENAYRI